MPMLIVADEPTGDLDRHSAAEILSMLQRLNTELAAVRTELARCVELLDRAPVTHNGSQAAEE